jgi:hypothetical protein
MSDDEGMTKSKDVRVVSHEALLERGGAAPLSIDAEAQEAKRCGDAQALQKPCEMIPISHSSFGISSSFVICHSSFL